jgi:hypothetical protein
VDVPHHVSSLAAERDQRSRNIKPAEMRVEYYRRSGIGCYPSKESAQFAPPLGRRDDYPIYVSLKGLEPRSTFRARWEDCDRSVSAGPSLSPNSGKHRNERASVWAFEIAEFEDSHGSGGFSDS